MNISAVNKLDAYGIEAVCEDIALGRSMTHVAFTVGVSIGSMLAWIAADPERSARVREVRVSMALHWDERAEAAISAASDEFELRKAKEISHHYRWRASKIAPKDYGDKQQVEHSGKVGLEHLVAGDE